MIPQQKIEANGNEIQGDCLSSTVWRIENGVSRASIVTKDSYGKHFIDDLDALDVLAISYKYAGQTVWKKVFEGKIREPTPTINSKQKITGVLAYGYGKPLLDTHCAVNYGVESKNNTIDTPSEIIADLVANRINKNFDGVNTGYSIDGTNVLAMANPSIQFIKGGYRNNFDILNQICLLYQAYRAGSSGIHWFVDPTEQLWVDQIGNHTVHADWPTWWRTNQAGSTLTEGIHFYNATFPKNAKGYANKIELFTDVRKPPYDYWTEFRGAGADTGNYLWGRHLLTSLTDSAAANKFVVGDYSLLGTSNGAVMGYFWFPSSSLSGNAAAAQKDVAVTTVTNFKVGDSVRLWDATPQGEDAVVVSIAGSTLTMVDNLTNAYTTANKAHCSVNLGWDCTKIGSELSPPTLNFYYYIDANVAVALTQVRLSTTSDFTSSDYFWCRFASNADKGQWHHCSIPFGDYAHSAYIQDKEFVAGGGAEDWGNINSIGFYVQGGGANGNLYIDDLHISGKIIREAYNSTAIAANDEVQKTIKLDISVDDSLKGAEDSGTAAQLAYAELLRTQYIPTTGQVTIKGIQDILPGQQVYINAHKSYNTYNITDTFRATQIIHKFEGNKFHTQLDLTDDLINSFGSGPGEQLSALAKVLYVDPEAKSLKSSGVDDLVARLSVDYP